MLLARQRAAERKGKLGTTCFNIVAVVPMNCIARWLRFGGRVGCGFEGFYTQPGLFRRGALSIYLAFCGGRSYSVVSPLISSYMKSPAQQQLLAVLNPAVRFNRSRDFPLESSVSPLFFLFLFSH